MFDKKLANLKSSQKSTNLQIVSKNIQVFWKIKFPNKILYTKKTLNHLFVHHLYKKFDISTRLDLV